MRIELAPKFHQRLDEIAICIYQQSLSNQFTVQYITQLKKHIIASLSTFSKIGRSAEEFGIDIRKLVYKRCSILYRIETDYILILTIYRENLPRL